MMVLTHVFQLIANLFLAGLAKMFLLAPGEIIGLVQGLVFCVQFGARNGWCN